MTVHYNSTTFIPRTYFSIKEEKNQHTFLENTYRVAQSRQLHYINTIKKVCSKNSSESEIVVPSGQ